MTALGMPGVWTWKFGEGFGHHYLDSVAMNHNSVGRGYETWGNATPETRAPRSSGPPQTTTEWYRPLPPPREFTWSARDNLNYTETGALSALDYVAGNAKAMLRNFYQKGWNSWRKGATEAPYAFVIPEDQGDRARVAQMVGRLLDQRIEVARATRAIALRGGPLPGRHLRRASRPALSQLRRGPADAAALPEGRRRALRRHLLVAARRTTASRRFRSRILPSPAAPDALAALGEAPRHGGPRGRRRPGLPAAGHRTGGAASPLAIAWRASSSRSPSAAVPRRKPRLSGRHAGSFRRTTGSAPRCEPWRPSSASTSRASRLRRRGARTRRPLRASASGCPGPTPTRSAGSATRSTSAACPTPTCATRTCGPGGSREKVDVLLYGHVDLELAEQIHGLPKQWGPMPYKKTAADAEPRHARGVGRHHRRHRLRGPRATCSASSRRAACS